ncbi:hypothetical protein [Leptolyngbya sp. PCC 6406]|uniref:hypothetical protein n=1 Tax=Leptolyngbya sp. PCC 6406 TaxID=1173264 RepID=UPI0012DF8084|nr:hypothetical protein [Leptolyngbya sp. PCC 6406]
MSYSPLALTLVPLVPIALVQPAQASAYQTIPQDQATSSWLDLVLGPGRSTALDFNLVQERIVFVNLADPSRTVFTSNAPIDSGNATTLFLTPIQPLAFPGATTNVVTTLQVQTLDPQGQLRLYSFNVRHQNRAAPYAAVRITPVSPSRPPTQTAIPTAQTLAQGLAIAIERGIVTPQDPLVATLEALIHQELSGSDLRAAAQAQGVPWDVLVALATLTPVP